MKYIRLKGVTDEEYLGLTEKHRALVIDSTGSRFVRWNAQILTKEVKVAVKVVSLDLPIGFVLALERAGSVVLVNIKPRDRCSRLKYHHDVLRGRVAEHSWEVWAMLAQYRSVQRSPIPLKDLRSQFKAKLANLADKTEDIVAEHAATTAQMVVEDLPKEEVSKDFKDTCKALKKVAHKAADKKHAFLRWRRLNAGTEPQIPPLPSGLTNIEFGSGDKKFERKIDNALTTNLGGRLDKEVQELPLYNPNPHLPTMGYGWRPLLENIKDKVFFWRSMPYEAPTVEADLYGELVLESMFQTRSHALLLHLKQKARKFMQRYDCRMFTRQTIARVIMNACTAAMFISEDEERSRNIIHRNRVAMREHAKYWASFKEVS